MSLVLLARNLDDTPVVRLRAGDSPPSDRLRFPGVLKPAEGVAGEDVAPQLREILAGTPLPAKTNLLTRWHGDADRDAGYVPVTLHLGPAPTPT
jgi:hypothetical protein